MFHDTEERCTISRKTNLLFQRWQKIGEFSPECLKVSKLGLWLDPFIQSRKCMSLKLTWVICHDNKEWCKIWRRIDLSFQNSKMRNLTNFDPSTQKSQKFELWWTPFEQSIQCLNNVHNVWTKYTMFEQSIQCLNKVCNVWTKYTMFEQSMQCLNKVYNVWTKYTVFEQSI